MEILFFGMLCASVFFLDWLVKNTAARHLGSALGAILLGALLSNVGVFPRPDEAPDLYRATLTFVAPFSIFFLTLQVRLRDLRLAGPHMLLAFGLALPGVLLGTWVGYKLFLHELALDLPSSQLAGMILAGHIGGSANFNAVGIHYGIIDSADVFLTALAVDHLFIALWIGATALIPAFFSRHASRENAAVLDKATLNAHSDPPFTLRGISLTLAAGFAAIWAAGALNSWFRGFDFQVPSILLVTAFALLLAQVEAFRKIAAFRVVGEFLVAVFLIVVGAHTNFDAILANESLALAVAGLVATILLIHGLVIFGIGRLLGIGVATLAVASQSCIGGPVSAAALAEVINREDLVVPAVLAGSLGAALGTFLGVFFTSML